MEEIYLDSWLTIPGEGDIGALNQRSRVNDLRAFACTFVPSYLRTFEGKKYYGQGVTGHRIDLYWSPRRNIRGIEYCHVIGPIGISAVTKFFDLIQIGHRD